MKTYLKVAVVFIIIIILGAFFLLRKDKTLSYDQKIQKCNFAIQESEAEFFLASTTNFVFVDQGTAPPPRGLSIYDLNKCQEVFSDRYSRPFEVKENTVTYWSPISELVTEINCPKKSEYESSGLGAGIEAFVSVNLTTLQKTDTGKNRCAARQ